jgi:hypothetical protein
MLIAAMDTTSRMLSMLASGTLNSAGSGLGHLAGEAEAEFPGDRDEVLEMPELHP